jgi:hypothetical protein
MNTSILPALLAALLSTAALAEDLAIKVEHESFTLDADGVTASPASANA